MKVPINNFDYIDLGASTLTAYEAKIWHGERWIIWCKYCRDWRDHGPGEWHREAHCNRDTPYHKTGYNFSIARFGVT